MHKLENRCFKINYAVIGLSEVKRISENLIRKWNNLFFYFGCTWEYSGSFNNKKKLAYKVVEVKGITE